MRRCGKADRPPLRPVGRGWGWGAAQHSIARAPLTRSLRDSTSPQKGERSGRVTLLAAFLFLTACQSTPPARDYAEFRSTRDPVTVATSISEQMRACWFGGVRPGFADYSYAPELNSFSGRPRVLVVQKSDPTGLPKLVVEASEAGRGSEIKLFGPLMASAEAPAISRDIGRWAGGTTGC